jgi:DNA-binding MarR family transcriptional regulator
MPRKPNASVHLDEAELAQEPVLPSGRVELASALQGFVTWATSTSMRESLMAESRFPLPGDLPAFLVVNQLIYRRFARPTDLADAIQTGRSNVSKIVRRLEEAGLVGRAPHPGDARNSAIGLTAAGRQVALRIAEAAGRLYGTALLGWTPKELREFERLAVKFAVSLNQATGSALERTAGVRLGTNPPA